MRLSLIIVVAMLCVAPATPHAQASTPASRATAVKSPYNGTTLEGMIPSGKNFDIAQFRLWYPDNVATLRGIVLLVPGSNGDGRASAQDTVWQAFAAKHKLALVACKDLQASRARKRAHVAVGYVGRRSVQLRICCVETGACYRICCQQGRHLLQRTAAPCGASSSGLAVCWW